MTEFDSSYKRGTGAFPVNGVNQRLDRSASIDEAGSKVSVVHSLDPRVWRAAMAGHGPNRP